MKKILLLFMILFTIGIVSAETCYQESPVTTNQTGTDTCSGLLYDGTSIVNTSLTGGNRPPIFYETYNLNTSYNTTGITWNFKADSGNSYNITIPNDCIGNNFSIKIIGKDSAYHDVGTEAFCINKTDNSLINIYTSPYEAASGTTYGYFDFSARIYDGNWATFGCGYALGFVEQCNGAGTFNVYEDAITIERTTSGLQTCSSCTETCSPCGGGCTATNLNNMYNGVTSFDSVIGNISGWDTSCITSMSSTFRSSDFNQDISGWNTSSITDMSAMFYSTSAFNKPLNTWDVSHVNTMSYMFGATSAFNQNLSNWNISSVTDITAMFDFATGFNGDISGWDISHITNMGYMFHVAQSFNQPLNTWDVSHVTNMDNLFRQSAFNQNIGMWNISSVTNMNDMFTGVTLSTSNYDSLLNGWASRSVQSNVAFNAGGSQYSSTGLSARNTTLIGVYNWNIIDGGLAIPPCTPNWIPTYSPSTCPSNSQWFVTYTDTNNCGTSPPIDNGTIISCTYIPPENNNQTFEGKTTTDLNTVANISAVENFTVATTGSAVQWTNTVDLANVTVLTDVVQSAPTFLSVNIIAAPTLDTPAAVALSVPASSNQCGNFLLYYAVGYYSTTAEIIQNGQIVATGSNIGGDCIDPSICTNVQCSNGVLTFTAQHFDGFGVGALTLDTPTNNGLLQTRNLVYAGLALLAVLIIVIVSFGLIQLIQGGNVDMMAITILAISGGIIIMLAYVIIYFVFIALGG